MAGGKVVAAVEHHVGACYQRVEQRGVGAHGQGGYSCMGVERLQRGLGGFDLGRAHARGGMGNLALQICQVHRVVVYQGNVAYAGAGQVHGRR